jgi:hypothetical protein
MSVLSALDTFGTKMTLLDVVGVREWRSVFRAVSIGLKTTLITHILLPAELSACLTGRGRQQTASMAKRGQVTGFLTPSPREAVGTPTMTRKSNSLANLQSALDQEDQVLLDPNPVQDRFHSSANPAGVPLRDRQRWPDLPQGLSAAAAAAAHADQPTSSMTPPRVLEHRKRALKSFQKTFRKPGPALVLCKALHAGRFGVHFDRFVYMPLYRLFRPRAPVAIYVVAGKGGAEPVELCARDALPERRNATRIVFVGDTMGKGRTLRLPASDLVVHCGDERGDGQQQDVLGAARWLGALPLHRARAVVGVGAAADAEVKAQCLRECDVYLLSNSECKVNDLVVFGSPDGDGLPAPGQRDAMNVALAKVRLRPLATLLTRAGRHRTRPCLCPAAWTPRP